MKRMCRWLALGALCAFPVSAVAQDEVEVDFCTDCPPADPGCCVDDTLEIVFDPMGAKDDSVFEYTDFVQGTQIDTAVVSDTVTADIQGWSFGVKHDTAVLTLIEDSVTTIGTDAEAASIGPLDFTGANQGGTGWIGAYVLSTRFPAELPTGQRNSLAFANYTLEADAGVDGTLIELVDKEVPPVPGASGVDVNFTITAMTRLPKKFVQGLVVKQGEPEVCDDGVDNDGDGDIDCEDADCDDDPACPDVEICDDGVDNDEDGDVDCADADCADDPACVETDCDDGEDNDGDGDVDCADSDCAGDPACEGECPPWAFYFGDAATEAAVAAGDDDSLAVGMRNIADAFAFQLGVRVTTAGGVSALEFSGELGADQQRVIELLITDDNGDSQDPVTPNSATANREPVDVVRGASVAGFADDDFFAVDLNPGVGGDGFTVGYVSDLNDDTNKIPATGAGDECPLNEVLEIRFTGVAANRFSRGDVDGNGKLNVSDAVLIVQIAVGNLAERFDCDDARDTNDDGQVDISDALPLLAWLFQRGPRLAEPFLACGADPTEDDLTCAESSPFCP